MLGYLATVLIEPACRRVFVGREVVGSDGLINDATVQCALGEALRSFAAAIAA